MTRREEDQDPHGQIRSRCDVAERLTSRSPSIGWTS